MKIRLVLAPVLIVFLTFLSSSYGQDGWGHLAGKIVVEGEVPARADLTIDTDDRAYCIQNGTDLKDRSLLVGAEGGLQEAYVMMYFKRGADRPKVHPSYDETKEKSVVMDNANCRFEPHAVMVRTGQTLKFTNSDNIGHNCHVITMGNEANFSLSTGQAVEVALEESDRVPGIIKCDAHGWMQGLILVRDEPYVAITDAEGKFLIQNIPAGKWTFQFWHKRMGFMKAMKKDGEAFLGRRGEIEVTITDGETFDLGKLVIAVNEFED